MGVLRCSEGQLQLRKEGLGVGGRGLPEFFGQAFCERGGYTQARVVLQPGCSADVRAEEVALLGAQGGCGACRRGGMAAGMGALSAGVSCMTTVPAA